MSAFYGLHFHFDCSQWTDRYALTIECNVNDDGDEKKYWNSLFVNEIWFFRVILCLRGGVVYFVNRFEFFFSSPIDFKVFFGEIIFCVVALRKFNILGKCNWRWGVNRTKHLHNDQPKLERSDGLFCRSIFFHFLISFFQFFWRSIWSEKTIELFSFGKMEIDRHNRWPIFIVCMAKMYFHLCKLMNDNSNWVFVGGEKNHMWSWIHPRIDGYSITLYLHVCASD